MCSRRVAGSCVVVLAATSGRGLLLERRRLRMLAFDHHPQTRRESSVAYLVDGHRAGIVLVAALCVHQLRHKGILAAIAG